MQAGLGLGYKARNNFTPSSLIPNWSAALKAQNAGSRSPILLALGDSTTFGSYSTGGTTGDLKALSYPTQLKNLFVSGGRTAQANSIISNGSSTAERSSSNDPRTIKGTSWATANATTKAVGGYCVSHSSATYDNCTYTFSGVDTFRMWYPLTVGGGNLIYSVDGGSTTSISTNASSEGKAYVDIAAGSVGSHTLTITTNSSALVFILGVEGYNSTVKELKIRNCGWAGSQTTAWIEATRPWSPLNNISGFTPDLTILCLGINDWVNGLAVGTFQTQFQTLVTAAKTSSDLLIVTPVPSDDTVRAYASQVTYINAMKAVATATNTPLLDMFSHFGTYATANANGWMANVSHPSAAGYAEIANKIYALIRN